MANQMETSTLELDTNVPDESQESEQEETSEGGAFQPVEVSEGFQLWLKTQIKKFAKEEDPNRRQEIIRARDGRMFWRGYQYAMLNSDSGAWAVPAAGGFPGAVTGGDAQEPPKMFYVTNIYTAYGKTLISALAGTTPGVKFLPVDSDDPKHLDA